MELTPDLEIIREVIGGNTEAFEIIVNRYQDKTYGFCYKILKDESNAIEAAHLSFIKAFENLGKFRMDSKFSTWFYRIVYNICLDQCRLDKRFIRDHEKAIEEDFSLAEVNSGLQLLTNEERKKYLDFAFESLGPEEASLMYQYYYEDFSVEDLANITGLTVSNIKIRLYRARKKMYLELKRHLKHEINSLIVR